MCAGIRSLSVRSFVLAVVAALIGTMAIGTVATPARATTVPGKVTAWLPYWDQARAMQSFLANADLYSAASPFWYEATSTGTVTRYPGAEDSGVLTGIRGKGVKVIPTVTNNFDASRMTTIFASDASRAAHAQVLVDLVQSMGYDGIDVDYESLAASDRDRFTSFVQILASALHAQGKLLTLAVHPKTSEPGTWSGPQAQDYAALGAAADRLRIMTYDYSWSTSPAGPIAPVGWMDQVAAFAVSAVAPSKIELGMSLYGYDWVGNQAQGVEFDTARNLLSTSGATRGWDANAQEPIFSYLSGGVSHTVYYADAQSISARLAVVDKYALAGAAFWRLGGEDATVWDAVRSRWGGTTGTATATTPSPAPVADTVKPSVPTGLAAVAGAYSKIALSWRAAADTGGSGLAGYELFRATYSGGSWSRIATLTSLSFTNTNLSRNHRYYYAVRAYDKAGNRSPLSPTISAVAK